MRTVVRKPGTEENVQGSDNFLNVVFDDVQCDAASGLIANESG